MVFTSYSMECGLGKHGMFSPFVFVFLVGFSLAFPSIVFGILVKNRKRLYMPSFQRRLGFLYAPFRFGSEYWEIHEVFRKMILTGALLFVADTQIRAAIASIVSLMAVGSLNFFRPHRNFAVFSLAQSGFLCISLKYLTAVLIDPNKVDNIDPSLGYALISIDIVFMAASFFFMGVAIHLLKVSIKATNKKLAREEKERKFDLIAKEEQGVLGKGWLEYAVRPGIQEPALSKYAQSFTSRRITIASFEPGIVHGASHLATLFESLGVEKPSHRKRILKAAKRSHKKLQKSKKLHAQLAENDQESKAPAAAAISPRRLSRGLSVRNMRAGMLQAQVSNIKEETKKHKESFVERFREQEVMADGRVRERLAERRRRSRVNQQLLPSNIKSWSAPPKGDGSTINIKDWSNTKTPVEAFREQLSRVLVRELVWDSAQIRAILCPNGGNVVPRKEFYALLHSVCASSSKLTMPNSTILEKTWANVQSFQKVSSGAGHSSVDFDTALYWLASGKITVLQTRSGGGLPNSGEKKDGGGGGGGGGGGSKDGGGRKDGGDGVGVGGGAASPTALSTLEQIELVRVSIANLTGDAGQLVGIFKKLDKDGSDCLSEKEFRKLCKKTLQKMDNCGDFDAGILEHVWNAAIKHGGESGATPPGLDVKRLREWLYDHDSEKLHNASGNSADHTPEYRQFYAMLTTSDVGSQKMARLMNMLDEQQSDLDRKDCGKMAKKICKKMKVAFDAELFSMLWQEMCANARPTALPPGTREVDRASARRFFFPS
jgi:hypothetical protein